MSGAQLGVTYVPVESVAALGAYWVRGEQVPFATDEATVDDAARVIDALFDLDPCDPENIPNGGDGAETDENGDVVPPVPEESFADAVRGLLGINVCGLDTENGYEAEIKVFRSHPEQYLVVLDNGSVLPGARVVEETVLFDKVIENKSSVTLDIPISGTVKGGWVGNVVDRYGTCPPPELVIMGSTVNFGKTVTGQLRLAVPTRYEIVTVHVDGVPEEVDIHGNPIKKDLDKARAMIFFHGMVAGVDIAPPQPDPSMSDLDEGWVCEGLRARPPGGGSWDDGDGTCYETVTKRQTCECSGDNQDGEPQQIEVPCPDGKAPRQSGVRRNLGSRTEDGGTASCKGDGDFPLTEKQVEDLCCVSVGRPKCLTVISPKPGGHEFNEKSSFGPAARLHALTPKGGCGRLITKFVLRQIDCCDEFVPDPVIIGVPKVVSPGETYYLHVSGGKRPFTWSGSNVTVEAVGWDGLVAKMITSEDGCGPFSVRVRDACNKEDTKDGRYPDGRWVPVSFSKCEKANGEAALYYNSYCGKNLHGTTVFGGRYYWMIAGASGGRLLTCDVDYCGNDSCTPSGFCGPGCDPPDWDTVFGCATPVYFDHINDWCNCYNNNGSSAGYCCSGTDSYGRLWKIWASNSVIGKYEWVCT